MSKEAAAGDMRMMARAEASELVGPAELSELVEVSEFAEFLMSFSARVLAVFTASASDSARVKRGSSGYFLNKSWPDSPIRTTCLICGAWRIS